MTFKQHQAAFANYIRHPHHSLPDGVQAKRMAMYRELFFNNIEGFLTANFPVLRSLFTLSDWLNLAHDFFAVHVCKTPHFSEIPEEFLAYLQHERKNTADLPFLFELAHYEWVEMALSISQAEGNTEIELIPDSDLMQLKFELSPVACILAYSFPVQQISPDFMPLSSNTATFLVVYRNREDNVQFLEITPLTFQLLQLVENQPSQTLTTYVNQLLPFAPTISIEVLQTKGLEMMADFIRRGVINILSGVNA